MKKFQNKLNLQFFAEDNPDGNPTPKVYTEEEYNKLKASFDKTSSDLAKMKKDLQSKLSEEEKKAKEIADREQHFKDMEERLANSEIKEALLENGVFNKDEVSKIIENKNDMKKLAVELSNIFKAKLENEKKKWLQELNDNSKTPGSKKNNSNESNYVIERARNFNNKNNDVEVQWGAFNK